MLYIITKRVKKNTEGKTFMMRARVHLCEINIVYCKAYSNFTSKLALNNYHFNAMHIDM